MRVTTLFAMNELTNSVSSSVDVLLLDPGEQFYRMFTIPDSASWNHIRMYWRETIVGTNFSESLTNFKYFAGISSQNRGYKVAGDAHCMGLSIVADPSNSESVTLTRVQAGTTVPTGSTQAWTSNQWTQTVITGSFVGGSGTTTYVPRYDTVYSPSHPSASLAGYPWKCHGVEIKKGGTNNYSMSVVAWRDVVGGTATGSEFNIPRGIFLAGLQSVTVFPGLFSGQGSPQTTWQKWFVDTTSSINLGGQSGTTVRSMLETTLGILNTVNFYWTCSNVNAKLAIRDLHVVKIS